MIRWLVLAFVMLACLAMTTAPYATAQQPLPTIGPAPDFTLTSQDNAPVTLGDFRGKVVAVTFIFTSCSSTCPLLTAKLAQVQNELGADFGAKIAFISITVDPDNDTPEVLKEYAQNVGADPAGWVFLTGDPAVVREVERQYGVFAATAVSGSIDHTFLTSLIDPRGNLRVQYIGVRFDPEEFRRDLLSLVNNP